MLITLLDWEYTTKVDIFRNALQDYYENKLLQKLLKTKQEVGSGIYFEGDLQEIAKNFKD